jgi:hypothetical protein
VIDRQHQSVSELFRLRLLVGFLGEKAQFGWWPTAFYEPSGIAFLEPIFPRTLDIARYQGVTAAARRVHDENLSIGSFHLFRLPEETEQDLHDFLRRTQLSSPGRTKENARGDLREFAGNASSDAVGPISMGSISEIGGRVKAIASAYASAFDAGVQVFPYLAR